MSVSINGSTLNAFAELTASIDAARSELDRLYALRAQSARCGGLSSGAFQRVQEYIDAQLHAEVCLQTLAQLAGLSLSHFARAFKETTGLSPRRYVMRMRVERAQRLIGSTDRPLADIGFAVGFADQSHFSKTFTRFTGLTPRAFRKAAS